MLQLVHVEGSVRPAERFDCMHGYAGIRIKINNTCLALWVCGCRVRSWVGRFGPGCG